MNISKITLGTAQIGFNYGIANVNGKPDFQTAIKLLKFAWDNGINTFDTAPDYGNSEEIIGSFISSLSKEFRGEIIISSKLPSIEKNKELTFDTIYNFIKDNIIQTLINLKLSILPIYLLHHAPDILIKDGLVIECLRDLKKEGLVKRFGISAYNLKDIQSSLKFKDIDVIQIPINIFDHRLIKTRILKKLKSKNYIIFARSVYLQGIFFMPLEKLPQNLKIAKEPLKVLRLLSSDYNIEISKIAFLFIRDIPEITSLVIGSETIKQIATNVKLLDEESLPQDLQQKIIEEFSELPEKIINPSMWNL